MKEKLLWLFLLAVLPLCSHAQGSMTLRDSLSMYIREVTRNPNSVPLRLAKARINMRLEQWQYAQEECTAILKIDNDNAEALYFRAYSYERLGRFDFAAADYERVCALVPGNMNALMGLALVRNKQGRKTEAMTTMNQLVSLYADSAIVYVARGNMEMEQNQLDAAEFDFAKATSLAPKCTDYLLLHAESLIRLGRKRDALAVLRRMEELGVPAASMAEYFRRCR